VKIPIENLYFIFSYAWARFPAGDAVQVGLDECPDLQNLFGKVLIDSVNQLMRRGLDRGYREIIEETRSPRGRLLFDQIAKEQTLRRGSVICQFDELSHDVPHNQIIKATARALSREPTMLPLLAHGLRVIERKLVAVSDVRLSSEMFRKVQLSRNTGQYGLLMRLCEFVFRANMPTEGGAGSRFADVMANQKMMAAVFEEFLKNFFAHEQKEFRVGPGGIEWDSRGTTDPLALQYLPGMRTDITLRSAKRVIVLDAKFYSTPFNARFGTPKVHSNNLYQLLTYLHHTAIRHPEHAIDGGLIYAAVGEPVSLTYRLMGYPVRVEAVDLTRPWKEIRTRLLAILEPGLATGGAGASQMSEMAVL
jgi:5-methylcytosine-specific restriction enzyme subunit McrC